MQALAENQEAAKSACHAHSFCACAIQRTCTIMQKRQDAIEVYRCSLSARSQPIQISLIHGQVIKFAV